MRDFVLTGEGVVGPAWIDENDHVNMMWYTHLIDVATGALLGQALGQPSGNGESFVAAHVAMHHRRELRLGDLWQTWSGFSGISKNSFSVAHKITRGKTIVARGDMIIVPFCHRTRTAKIFSQSLLDAASQFLISGLAHDRK